MAGSPDSVVFKLRRAKENAQALEVEIERYFKSEPCHIVGQLQPDGNLVAKLEIVTAVSPQIALIIGDCLQNLRTCLDYLVWELVISANGNPAEKNAFPVCKKPSAFRDELKRGKLDGVPFGAIDLIESFQPYQSGDDWEGSIPWVLNQLANINKHRRILLTVLNPFFTKDPIVAATPNGQMSRVPGVGPKTEAQVTVTRWSSGKVEMNAVAAVNIVFDEGRVQGRDVTQVIAVIADWIENKVLPGFTAFF